MISKAQAVTMRYRQEFYGAVSIFGLGSDKRPRRVRVSGQCQTWKTRPVEFRLPFKHGLYDNGAVTEGNAAQFCLSEDEARQA